MLNPPFTLRIKRSRPERRRRILVDRVLYSSLYILIATSREVTLAVAISRSPFDKLRTNG